MKGIYHSSDFHSSSSDIPIGETFGIILDKTNFYAQQGGQVNDTGTLSVGDDARFTVEDAQVFNGYVLHIGKLESGTITIGDRVKSTYDEVSQAGCTSRHVPRSRCSSAADLSGTIIPPPISSASLSAKSSATTLPRKAHSSLQTSCASTSRTRSPSLSRLLYRSRRSAMTGSARPQRYMRVRCRSRRLRGSLVCARYSGRRTRIRCGSFPLGLHWRRSRGMSPIPSGWRRASSFVAERG